MLPSRLLALALTASVLAAPACRSACGSYASSCGLVVGDVDVDRDDWMEFCGTGMGTVGEMAFRDGTAVINFGPDHRSTEVSAAASRLDLYVVFLREELTPGSDLQLASGGAGVVGVSEVPLTQGDIHVVEHSSPVCRGIPQQDFRLDWDLEWGDPDAGDEWYTAEAVDWVRFDLEDDHEVCEDLER